jgi:hypothetical protein
MTQRRILIIEGYAAGVSRKGVFETRPLLRRNSPADSSDEMTDSSPSCTYRRVLIFQVCEGLYNSTYSD